MSDFLFIIPEGWIQIDWATASAVNPELNPTNVNNWIATEQYSYIHDALVAQNMLEQDDIIVGAKLFNGEVLAITLG